MVYHTRVKSLLGEAGTVIKQLREMSNSDTVVRQLREMRNLYKCVLHRYNPPPFDLIPVDENSLGQAPYIYWKKLLVRFLFADYSRVW